MCIPKGGHVAGTRCFQLEEQPNFVVRGTQALRQRVDHVTVNRTRELRVQALDSCLTLARDAQYLRIPVSYNVGAARLTRKESHFTHHRTGAVCAQALRFVCARRAEPQQNLHPATDDKHELIARLSLPHHPFASGYAPVLTK